MESQGTQSTSEDKVIYDRFLILIPVQLSIQLFSGSPLCDHSALWLQQLSATSSSGSAPACRMSSSKHWEYNSWRKGMEWYIGTFQKRRDKIRLRFIGHEIHLTGKHTWDFNHAQMVGLWHCVSTLLVLHAISRYWLANSNDHVGIQKKWSTTSVCLRTSLLWESLFMSYMSCNVKIGTLICSWSNKNTARGRSWKPYVISH